MIIIVRLALILLPLFAFGTTPSEQNDKEFEIEAEKVEMTETEETLKASKEELKKQKKTEKDIENRLDQAKVENKKFKTQVLPQIEVYKTLLIHSDQAQKRNLAHLAELTKENNLIKEEHAQLKAQLAQLNKEIRDTNVQIQQLKKDTSELKKKNAELAKQNKIAQKRGQDNKKAITNLQRQKDALSPKKPTKSP